MKSVLTCAISFYLIGCFMSASFDITKWDYALRMTIGIVGGIISLGVLMVKYLEGELKK